MSTLNLAVALITATAYLLSALRLACYCRGASRFRWGVSLSASLLGAALCLSALDILLSKSPVSLWHGVSTVLLCILIFRSRGNVAALLRLDL
jgi:hypothetical protein